MALCHEFGVRICDDACSVAMVAGSSACYCAHCGAICSGQFGGCAAVWASGRNGDGVEVDIRVTGPVEGATCLSAKEQAISHNGTAPEVQPVIDGPSGLLGAMAALAEHMAQIQLQIDNLEAIVRGGAPQPGNGVASQSEPPAWAEQMRLEILELRAAMKSLIG